MNSSPWVDPTLCRTCGVCCKYFEVAYPQKASRLYLSEIPRFQMLAKIGDYITTREDGDTTWLRFNIPCRYLVEGEGHYSCAIYDSPERPLLCLQYPYRESTDCPHKRSTAVRP